MTYDQNDQETLFSEIIVILILCAITGWGVYKLLTVSIYLAIAACLLIVGIFSYFLYTKRNVKSISTLERDICNTLDKQGYWNEKHDGTLYIKKHNRTYHIHLWDTTNKRIKQLYFVYDFQDERHPNISKEGWMMATNRINVDNLHSTFITHDDSFRCRYETAIGNAKDFMNEFEMAHEIIDNVLEEFNWVYPYLERDYPNTNKGGTNSIGFNAS
mgnify:FL=1